MSRTPHTSAPTQHWHARGRRRRATRRVRALAVAAAGVAAVGGFLGAVAAVHAGEVLPGVVADGAPVGGLGPDDTRAAIARLVEARRDDPVTFTLDGREFVYRPGTTYRTDLDAAVEELFAAGRGGGPLRGAWAHVAAVFGRRIDVTVTGDLERDAVAAFVAGVAAEVDRDPFPGRVTADPQSLAVRAEPPAAGVEVRSEPAVGAVVAAVLRPGPDRLPLPVAELPTTVDPSEVERLAAQARRVLSRPLVLTTDDLEITLRPPDLAPLIDTRPLPGSGGEDRLVFAVPAERVAAVFERHLDRLDVAPREATFRVLDDVETFDVKGDATWTSRPAELEVVPGADGRRLDPDRVAAQLEQLFAAGRDRAELDLVVLKPELSTDEARTLGVNHLIGTFTTYHRCCQNRVRNIQRMADLVRGAVLRPGETFSVNNHVGRRTRGNGFLADGTIVGGEYVQEVGGGVSQFATTMYNAAFFAGLDIVDHKAHSYYISRYPMGREATLYYPSVDLKVRNNTDRGVYVHTSYTDTSITVSLFGDNGGLTVEAVHGEPTNFRTHRTVVRHNDRLRPGARRVVQQGGRGFDVTVVRVVSRGGEREEERILTRYLAPLEIVEVGPARSADAADDGGADSSPQPDVSDKPSAAPPSPDPSPG